MVKEAVMIFFKVLSQHLLGVTKKTQKQPQSGYPVSSPTFETGIY